MKKLINFIGKNLVASSGKAFFKLSIGCFISQLSLPAPEHLTFLKEVLTGMAVSNILLLLMKNVKVWSKVFPAHNLFRYFGNVEVTARHICRISNLCKRKEQGSYVYSISLKYVYFSTSKSLAIYCSQECFRNFVTKLFVSR